jgi:glycosyltransferase involved in cell wall biosynthesis
LGHCPDVPSLYSQAHIVTLPSYYGEGLPKSLIEAAACGRVVVTTDMPGCRDAIEPGVTGLLVPARDVVALADAIEQLIRDDVLRKAMGRAGRNLAEREFGIENAVSAHLQIYRELLKPCGS